MPRLMILLMESATTTSADDANDVGAIYKQPFKPALQMWSFSARILQALCNHTWEPTQDYNRLALVLTPELPPGTSRVVDDLGDYRRLFVGLDPDRWNRALPAEQRAMLIDLAMRELEPLRDTWAIDWPKMQEAARDQLAAQASLSGTVADAAPISIGDAFESLRTVETWSSTTSVHRLAAGQAVAARVRETGRAIDEPELVTLPGGQTIVRARIDGVPFVLVPGGRMRRGFDEAQLALLDKVYEEVWADGSESDRKTMPRTLTAFGSDAACRLDLSGEVDLSPMWMAENVLDIDEAPDPWNVDDPPHGVVRWPTALALLTERRQSLPTSDELLWAASAGGATLFPWGDDPAPIRELLDDGADELAAAYGLAFDENGEPVESGVEPTDDAEPAADVEPERRNPFDAGPFLVLNGTNAFGLVAALSNATWCMPELSSETATPLVTVGGALGWYPWQGGWEAMLFLTRVVSRLTLEGRTGAWRSALRPILRLVR